MEPPTLEIALWLAALADAAGSPVDLGALADLMEQLVAVAPVAAQA